MTRSVLTLPGADGAELVAVVHEPAGPPVSVTVLLAGGVLPRMGVNRVLVRMADRLAAAGHRVVRVDLHGLGESGGTLPGEEVFPSAAPGRVGGVRRRHEAGRPRRSRLQMRVCRLCSSGPAGGNHGAPRRRAARASERRDRRGACRSSAAARASRPGYARRTERRRALRQLAELRHRTGSGRVRRVIRPLVWSLMPRLSRRLPDDADRWLNTPLLGSMRALYARRLPVSLLYGENDIVRDEIEELFLGLQPAERASLVRARPDPGRRASARRPGRGRRGRGADPALRRATARARRAHGERREPGAAPCW